MLIIHLFYVTLPKSASGTTVMKIIGHIVDVVRRDIYDGVVVVEGGKIAEASIFCENKNDESKLFRFNFFGDTANAKVG